VEDTPAGTLIPMVSFTCNICGAANEVERFASEPATCGCGSNVRLRALIHLLSLELFGRSLPLPDFPRMKAIRGIGMSDKECYNGLLAEKFDYTNTFYDREPRLDFTQPHPELAGQYDFILSADVLEHIAPPVERALAEAHRMLKPQGFLGITVYCHPSDQLREHYPTLHEFRIVPLGESSVLINRREDGSLEIRDDLVFHGGSGATLEMREYGASALRAQLLAAGFHAVDFLTGNVPEIGVLFDHDTSQPLIARNGEFTFDHCAGHQLVDALQSAELRATAEKERADLLAERIRLAAGSRWVRLGRALGIGPKFE
jgi:SAM-dependent methyltransferase